MKNDSKVIKVENGDKWLFWPNIVLSLIFALNNSLMGIAIPILYSGTVDIGFIGIISSALTVTYSFSPLLFIRASKKIGKKKAVIISTVGISLIRISYYFSLMPTLFLFTRLLEGMLLGLLFPNLISSISSKPNIDHSMYLANFNLSWNVGVIIGYSVGALFLFFIPQITLIFYLTPVLSITNAVVGILFFKDPQSQEEKLNYSGKDPDNLEDSKRMDQPLLKIPILLPILLLLGFALSQITIGFLFPIKSKNLNLDPYGVYILSFCAIIIQTILIYYENLWELKIQKITTLIIFPFFIIGSILFAFMENYFIILILYIVMGITAGILYGTLSKFFLMLNIQRNTSKYSNMMESFTGISFFMGQILLGFIADVSLVYAFITCSIVGIILFPFTIYLMKKATTSEKT